jgi:hypothetical protein
MMKTGFMRFGVLGLALACILSVPASAESRYRWIPDFMEPSPGSFFFDDEEEDEEDIIVVPRRQISIYEEDLDEYYEPRYEPKPKKPVQKAVQQPTVKKPVKKVAATPKAQPEKKKTPVAATGISCDKGASVVSEYGFSNVEPKTCTGKIYTFKAARTGKSYDVSVSSANGEITEVRKIQ